MYRINLLPRELQREFNVDTGRLLKVGVILLVFLGAVICYGTFLYRYFSIMSELSKVEARLDELRPQAVRTERLHEERRGAEAKVRAYKKLLATRRTWSRMLSDLGRTLPVDMWLVSVEISYREEFALKGGFSSPPGVRERMGGAAGDEREMNVREKREDGELSPPAPNVVVIQGGSRSVASVGTYVHSLYNLPYFKEVHLIELSEGRGEGTHTFTVEAVLSGDSDGS